jgi:glucose/mannose-6-phosphate isomerase
MDSPVDENKAKRIAGQLVGRIPVIWAGAGLLAPVARRWMTQINENSKSAAYFELMPELNHNTVVGIEEPKTFIDRVAVIQLMSRTYDHPRVTIRHKTTHKLYLQNGLLTEMLYAHGNSRLAQQMNLVQFGDYVSYYLAMAYSIDPTPIGPIDALKAALAKVK